MGHVWYWRFARFKLVGKPLLGVSKGILGIIGKLEKLGNTAQREAFKTRKALEDVDSAAQKLAHQRILPLVQIYRNPYRLDLLAK